AGVAAATIYYPAGVVVLGMRFKKMIAAERARRALVEMLPFVECSARCHNSLVAGPEQVPALPPAPAGGRAHHPRPTPPPWPDPYRLTEPVPATPVRAVHAAEERRRRGRARARRGSCRAGPCRAGPGTGRSRPPRR